LYVHVCKRETLWEAYRLAKRNNGAPGIDGVTFEAVEAEGVEGFLDQLRKELEQRSYRPQRVRKVEIPKEGGKVRLLSIPTIRDRVVQGALKLILEPIFEADFQGGSFGYRPKKSAHAAIRRVTAAMVSGKTYVIDLDLRSYFDTVKHHIVLKKVAGRVRDEEVLWLLRLLLKASGKQGVPQGGVISPLLSNVYLNEVDQMLERAKQITRRGQWVGVHAACRFREPTRPCFTPRSSNFNSPPSTRKSSRGIGDVPRGLAVRLPARGVGEEPVPERPGKPSWLDGQSTPGQR